MAPKVVFLDAAGTLFRLKQPVGEIYAENARRYGLNVGAVSAGEIGEAFARELRAQPPLAFGTLGPDAREEAERDWWRRLVRRVFAPLGSSQRFDDLFRDLFEQFADARHWELEPGCRDLLEGLAERGIRRGVISNFDSRLLTVLDGLGIARYFETIVVSSRCPAAKPDPTIFALACERIGCRADEAVHIGDSPLEDAQGASNAGLRAVLYDPHDRHPEFGGQRIGRLTDARLLV